MHLLGFTVYFKHVYLSCTQKNIQKKLLCAYLSCISMLLRGESFGFKIKSPLKQNVSQLRNDKRLVVSIVFFFFLKQG